MRGPVPNVFPSQDPGARRLALIGEAPGADEVAMGYPFAGKSGWWLNQWLSGCGVSRYSCFVGNVCQMRPSSTSNEFDLLEWNGPEVQAGIEALRRDLAAFRPHCVIALGNAALHLFRHGNVSPGKSAKLGLFQWPSKVSVWRGSLFEAARSFDGWEAADVRVTRGRRAQARATISEGVREPQSRLLGSHPCGESSLAAIPSTNLAGCGAASQPEKVVDARSQECPCSGPALSLANAAALSPATSAAEANQPSLVGGLGNLRDDALSATETRLGTSGVAGDGSPQRYALSQGLGSNPIGGSAFVCPPTPSGLQQPSQSAGGTLLVPVAGVRVDHGASSSCAMAEPLSFGGCGDRVPGVEKSPELLALPTPPSPSPTFSPVAISSRDASPGATNHSAVAVTGRDSLDLGGCEEQQRSGTKSCASSEATNGPVGTLDAAHNEAASLAIPREHSYSPSTWKVLSTYHPALTFREPSATYCIVNDLKRAVAEATSPLLELPRRDIVWDLSLDEIVARCEAMRAAQQPVGFDIEGGLGGLQCCSFATSPNEAFVIDLMERDWDYARKMAAIAVVLEDPGVAKVCWNTMYERAVLQAVAGITMRGYEDGMLAWWERFSELPKGLDFVGSILTREPYWSEGIGWDKRTGAPKVTGAPFYLYNGLDSCVTLECWEHPLLRGASEARMPVRFEV